MNSPTSQEWDPKGCNQQNGYERGYNDALAGNAMNTLFGQWCREDLRESTYKGYREGFGAGTSRKDELVKQERADSAGSRFSSPRAYECKAKAFLDEFDGYGRTQAEAQSTALDACKARYHEMHCEIAECRKTE